MTRALVAGWVYVWLTLFAVNGFAADSFIVDDIRVEGLERISPGAIFNYLPISVGDSVDEKRSRDAVRALFKTGLFKDVRLERDGDVLVVIIKERETISDITFEGNKSIKTEDLIKGLKEVGFAKGEVFNESKLDKVQQEVKRQYFANGRYAVRIENEIIPVDDKTIEVAFTISEGAAARIKQINIIGNQAFSEKEIRENFKLTTPTWLSWFTKDDQYSKQKLSGDLESLRSLYQDNGYLNFNVDSTQVSITPDKEDVYVTINVSEGDKFAVGDVHLAGTLIVKPEELFKLVITRKGMVFSRKDLTATSKAITERLGDEGYAFANVNASPNIDDKKRLAGITFFIDPGQRVYVRRVNFFGNAKTRDEVLRREMRQLEGGWISTTKVERSKIRLKRLGFFEDVNVETPAVPGSTDLVDVNFTVKERPSGNLMLGVGFSQSAGIIFNTNIQQDNFLGSGKSVSFGFNNSEIQQLFRLGFMDPYWSLDGVSRGFDVSYQKTNAGNTNVIRYNSEMFTGGVTFGLPITEFHFVNLGFNYESQKIDATPGLIDPAVEDFLNRQGHKYDTFKVAASFSYDTRNAAIFPDRGTLQRLRTDVAVPGGDLTFFKTYYESHFYMPLVKKYILVMKGQVGYGQGYGSTDVLPFFENFYGGGPRTVRGYEENSLGPRDIFGRSLGGDLSAVGSGEVILPVPFLAQLKSVRLSAFFDIGNVFDTSGSSVITCNSLSNITCVHYNVEPISFNSLRMSAGISGIWMSPFGLLSVSLAQPFNAITSDGPPGSFRLKDKIQRFQFNFGTQF